MKVCKTTVYKDKLLNSSSVITTTEVSMFVILHSQYNWKINYFNWVEDSSFITGRKNCWGFFTTFFNIKQWKKLF